ncbi:MAG: type I restriction enzyme HsdR N-terminal domain-containing protein [Planctomycetes bacterium]|nr:type I restriction enzyme HsdR N-terminal domain-containing protein [Planctomycetota bacterium]
MAIPKRVHERIVAGLKQYLPIIAQQRDRDVSEADTVTLVKDIMSDVFGYDKYAELTSEYAIRGTYCDLAVKIEGKLVLLCEVKAIGIPLEDKHVKQAVDYAANQGCEWVILTNGIFWRLYNVSFTKPIDKKQIVEIDLTAVNVKSERDMDCLYALTKEGFLKGAHIALKDLHEATSRHLIGALLVENESVVSVIKRELKRVVDASIDEATIRRVITEEIFKRDIVDGPEWKEAVARVNRKEGRALRTRTKTELPPAPSASVPSSVRSATPEQQATEQ